jgi:hypothetical protein
MHGETNIKIKKESFLLTDSSRNHLKREEPVEVIYFQVYSKPFLSIKMSRTLG